MSKEEICMEFIILVVAFLVALGLEKSPEERQVKVAKRHSLRPVTHSANSTESFLKSA